MFSTESDNPDSWWSNHPFLTSILATFFMLAMVVILVNVAFRMPWLTATDGRAFATLFTAVLAAIPLSLVLLRLVGIRAFTVRNHAELTPGITAVAVAALGISEFVWFAVADWPNAARVAVGLAAVIGVLSAALWVRARRP